MVRIGNRLAGAGAAVALGLVCTVPAMAVTVAATPAAAVRHQTEQDVAYGTAAACLADLRQRGADDHENSARPACPRMLRWFEQLAR
jgi:hypothetical protein